MLSQLLHPTHASLSQYWYFIEPLTPPHIDDGAGNLFTIYTHTRCESGTPLVLARIV